MQIRRIIFSLLLVGLLAGVCLGSYFAATSSNAQPQKEANNGVSDPDPVELASLGQPEVSLQKQRFVDNKDGTVTDLRSGLTWLKHADCFGTQSWNEALELAASLANGELCGDMELTDGSSPGEWRLPSIREIMTLPMIEYFNPALTNSMGTGKWSEGDPFLGVSSQYYWSSTHLEDKSAWYMYLYNGVLGISEMSQHYSVWPVKGQLKRVWDVGS